MNEFLLSTFDSCRLSGSRHGPLLRSADDQNRTAPLVLRGGNRCYQPSLRQKPSASCNCLEQEVAPLSGLPFYREGRGFHGTGQASPEIFVVHHRDTRAQSSSVHTRTLSNITFHKALDNKIENYKTLTPVPSWRSAVWLPSPRQPRAAEHFLSGSQPHACPLLLDGIGKDLPASQVQRLLQVRASYCTAQTTTPRGHVQPNENTVHVPHRWHFEISAQVASFFSPSNLFHGDSSQQCFFCVFQHLFLFL